MTRWEKAALVIWGLVALIGAIALVLGLLSLALAQANTPVAPGPITINNGSGIWDAWTWGDWMTVGLLALLVIVALVGSLLRGRWQA